MRAPHRCVPAEEARNRLALGRFHSALVTNARRHLDSVRLLSLRAPVLDTQHGLIEVICSSSSLEAGLSQERVFRVTFSADTSQPP